MTKIYREELESGTIAKIEVLENEQAMKRQTQLQQQDVEHVIRRSVCVVLTSKPGGFSEAVGLKPERYPLHMQRSIRQWNGPIPWPVGNANRTTLALDW